RLLDEASPPAPAFAAAVDDSAHPLDPGPGDPRLLPPARLHADRYAHLLARRRRGFADPLFGRLLRQAGLPGSNRSALPRGGRNGAGSGLLLRPHLPRRKEQDPP